MMEKTVVNDARHFDVVVILYMILQYFAIFYQNDPVELFTLHQTVSKVCASMGK